MGNKPRANPTPFLGEETAYEIIKQQCADEEHWGGREGRGERRELQRRRSMWRSRAESLGLPQGGRSLERGALVTHITLSCATLAGVGNDMKKQRQKWRGQSEATMIIQEGGHSDPAEAAEVTRGE